MRLILLALLLPLSSVVRAQELKCPSHVETCKVWILTPQEETMLIQPNGVFDTATQGRLIDLGPVVNYYRHKLEQAQVLTTPVKTVPDPVPIPQPVPLPQSRPPQVDNPKLRQ